MVVWQEQLVLPEMNPDFDDSAVGCVIDLNL
jgi:hypothetical protein